MNKIYIAGLVELSIYEGETSDNEKIKILLAGDSHTYEYNQNFPDVIDAEMFIRNTIETGTNLKDIYIELPYSERKRKPQLIPLTNYMANVQRTYIDNFEWGKIKNSNIRAHYVDLRRNASWDKELEDLRTVINIEYYKNLGFHNESKVKNYLKKIKNNKGLHNKLKTILGSKESIIEYVATTINYTKIPKQLKSMYSNNWRESLLEMSDKWLNNLIDDEDIEWKWLYWKNILRELKSGSSKNIGDIYYALTAYFGIYMDIYTIARMFRNFEDQPNEYSKKPLEIVVYAGSFHTNRIATYLDKIGFTKIVHLMEKSKDDNCLGLNKKFLPIFI